MRQTVPHHSNKAHTKASFYTALSGYIETFSPLPSFMIGKSYADRSAESWLDIAERLASQLVPEKSNPFAIIERVKTLVNQKKFNEARSIVRQGTDDAEAEIRQQLNELSR
jgi:hypothetical protein